MLAMFLGALKMSSVFDITTYEFSSSDRLFLDTNIWFFIYGPSQPGSKKTRIYSDALDKILKTDGQVYIDGLIISEFINAYARLEYHILRRTSKTVPGSFKAFRQTDDFRPIAQGIAADVRRILRHAALVGSGFVDIDIQSLVNRYARGDFDFNDQVISELCRRRQLRLITDDGDFCCDRLDIITANNRLLARRSEEQEQRQ
jgi:predicted nucleic acid-binding protein